MSFSGQDYNIVSYGVNEEGKIDLEDFKEKLYKYEPHMIIVGASSYSQIIDYKVFNDILDDFVNTKGYRPIYMVDMAHVAGLVAAGVHPNPCEYADVVTSTTHKTLRGPRGGLILTNDPEIAKKIDKAVFPGIQGGPLEHIIAAKGICFEEAMTDEFRLYAKHVIDNAKSFANEFINLGYKVISNGTENHMFVLDVYSSTGLTGKEVETALDKINITVNKNQIPNDTLPPLKSSGIRLGTAAMTTKGWRDEDFVILADIINNYLLEVKANLIGDTRLIEYKEKVLKLINIVKKRGEY